MEGYQLTASVHTLAIKTAERVENVDEDVSKAVLVSNRENGQESTLVINPNKILGDLYKYSEFEAAFGSILGGCGVEDYSLVRVDLRMDSYDSGFYQRFAKLHRLLIACLAVTYSVRNVYRSANLFSGQQLSVAAKNRRFEVEFYDKSAESGGVDIAESRLELRSKDWKDNKDIKYEFTVHWSDRLGKALKNVNLVYKRFNDEMEKAYLEGRDAFPKRFRSINDFLAQNQDRIFTKQQLIDLLGRLPEVGADRAKVKAKNFIQRYGLEVIKIKDLERAVAEIERSTAAFFDG